jgi:hypothetical protein
MGKWTCHLLMSDKASARCSLFKHFFNYTIFKG